MYSDGNLYCVGATVAAFAGPANRDILLAASLDNPARQRYDDIGLRGLCLHHLPILKGDLH